MSKISETAKKRRKKIEEDDVYPRGKPDTWNPHDKGPNRSDPPLEIPEFKINRPKPKNGRLK